MPVPHGKAAPAAVGRPAAKQIAEPAQSFVFDAPPAARRRATPTPRRAEREPAPRVVASGPFEQIAEAGAPEAATALVETAPVETAAAAAPTASLPLSNATIARTIGRIGYACGSVASASALEGGAGFKVTCTSGDSYRASQVRGRYHFKRLGSH